GFEGFEMSARYENASNSAYSVSVATGTRFDRGSFNLYGTYYHQTRNDRTDFDWLNERINGDGDFTESNLISGSGAPGTYELALLDDDGNFLGDSGALVPDPDCEEAGGVLTRGRCRHRFDDQVSVIPEEDRLQMFVEADYELNEWAVAYTEWSFSNNSIFRTNGPNLYRNGLADGNMLIPGDHPFNFFVSDGADGIMYIGPEAWDNDIHTGVPLVCNCRPLGNEFNGEGSEFDAEIQNNYFRALGGMEFSLPGGWTVDASYVYNKAERESLFAYGWVASELNAALASGEYNPFGTRTVQPDLISPKDGVSVAGFNREAFERYHHRNLETAEATQAVADIVASGDLFTVQGNTVAVALGAQYRDESFEEIRDPLDAAGLDSTPDQEAPFIEGAQTVYAGFGETLIPIGDDFELSVAVRHESYEGGIGSTTDPKIGARWDVTDAFALRASYGTSFQAPSPFQTSVASGTAFIDDPTTLDANGNLICEDSGLTSNTTIIVAGSPNLAPQTAKNINAGVILNLIPGLTFSADYWRFDYTDLIARDAEPQAIVDAQCPNGSDGSLAIIDDRVGRSPSGQIRTVRTEFINTGSVLTDGLDFKMNYGRDIGELGYVGLDVGASYVNKFDIEVVDGAPIIDGAGSRNFRTPFRSVPELRGNARLTWNLNNHTANASVRYIDSYENDQPNEPIEIDSWTSLDLRYAYSFFDLFDTDTTIVVGVNNVADQDPPSLGQGIRPAYDDAVHEIRGRLFFTELRVAF
ncbi:MAG: TonB-dependent receptor, partial [Caulobacterales bacterium]|nr:TonB-dependent receptor [Caulobacterales bacterium]